MVASLAGCKWGYRPLSSRTTGQHHKRPASARQCRPQPRPVQSKRLLLIVDNHDSTVDSFRLINPRWLDMLSERWWQKVLSSITLLIGTHGWLS